MMRGASLLLFFLSTIGLVRAEQAAYQALGMGQRDCGRIDSATGHDHVSVVLRVEYVRRTSARTAYSWIA